MRIRTLPKVTNHCDLNVCVPPNSYVEILMPYGIILGGGAVG